MNNGVKVVVDAGHGGTDSGAVNGKIYEKDLTLKIANYIFNRLNELGIPAVMTRDSDIYLPKTDRINKVRSISPNSPDIILLSNHINAGGGEGAEVVYGLRNNSKLADMILNNLGEAGQIKRKTYQRRLPESPNQDYYYIIRDTNPRESVLIEYGFIDNKKDLNKLQNNIENYGEAVVKAVADYLGVNYNNSNINQEKYIVKPGDTLYSIGKRYGLSVDELKSINNLNNNTLSIGQELSLIKKDDNEENINDEIYIVQKGDSLYGIAKKYGVTVDELVNYNKLNNLTIYIGDELKIPKEVKENIYIVQKGDTLYSIARKNNITVEDLINANELGSIILSIDQELIIPQK